MHFDWTINLGNVLTIAFVAASALKWLRRIPVNMKMNISALQLNVGVLQTTAETHDTWIAEHQKCNERQAALLSELRTDLAYLRGVSDAQAQRDSIHKLKDKY